MGSGGNTRAARTRVLICEDEALTALHLQKVLEAEGYEVVGEASNGEEAVTFARILRPDVVLMDINMPRLDGVSATERIIREHPTAVVMVTAQSEREMVERALKAGASGYLVKPVRYEQLVPAITVALARFADLRAYEQQTESLGQRNRELASASRKDRRLLEEAERQASVTAQRVQDLVRELRQEREVAQALAESFLPQVPEIPGFEAATCYQPASRDARIGGDFLDFIELDRRRIGLVIGDLCGHGIEAAAHLARAKYMLRAYALDDAAPAGVVARLNRALHHHLSAAEDCQFLTLIYGTLDLRTRELTYCNAGHPSAVLHHPSWSGCTELRATGGLVGPLEDMEYTQESALLEPGTTLALFTDGVVEARLGGRMLGQSGVCEVLEEHAGAHAAAIAGALRDRAFRFSAGELRDDVAIAVLRSV